MRSVNGETLHQGLILASLLGLSMAFYPLFAQNSLKPLPQNSPSALLKQYDSLASVYLHSGEADKMYLMVQKGWNLAVKDKNERYQGIFLLQRAGYFKRKYNADSGLFYANKAMPILQRHKEWKRISQLMYRKSTFYLDNQDQVNAVRELSALLHFNEKHNEHSSNGSIYHLLAFTFNRLNDTINEKKYILKHLALAEKLKSDGDRAYAYSAWAYFLGRQKKYRLAQVYHAKSYAIIKLKKEDEPITESLLSMGENLIILKDYPQSLKLLRKAEEISQKHASESGWNAILSTNYAHISSLFLATGKPREALKYARRSFALVKNEPLRYEYLIRALKNQIAAQKVLGRHKDALNSYEQLQTVTQSIDANKDREIAKNIEAKYQFEKIEREKESAEKSLQIKELELQNQQKQRKLLSALLGLFALLLCGGFWIYQKNQIYNHRISKKNQQLEVLNETKDKLFGIIGHDLRAPVVDLINTITLLENTGLTAEQLSVQSSVLRKKAITLQTILNNLLYWAFSQRHLLRANPRRIPLKNSIEEALDSLNGLMQEKSLEVKWLTVPKNRIYADENHVQIVLYNVLHNAIKFSPYNSTIEINATTEAPYAVLRVSNKGKEFEWEGSAVKPIPAVSHQGTLGEKGTGLGLLVCAELMKLNQGTIRAQRRPTEGTTMVLAFSSSI
ncbi:tetratricopeptide repeat-containing sensor histidine kinase [Runella sp.]|uniref:tetratricopeptide repeat-containing sensor histidine kinase n=1 Tax=Runella sp. TaxID=1960881 RepID=UPI003D0BDBFB